MTRQHESKWAKRFLKLTYLALFLSLASTAAVAPLLAQACLYVAMLVSFGATMHYQIKSEKEL